MRGTATGGSVGADTASRFVVDILNSACYEPFDPPIKGLRPMAFAILLSTTAGWAPEVVIDVRQGVPRAEVTATPGQQIAWIECPYAHVLRLFDRRVGAPVRGLLAEPARWGLRFETLLHLGGLVEEWYPSWRSAVDVADLPLQRDLAGAVS